MKTQFKKIIAFACVLCLMLSSLVFTASADGGTIKSNKQSVAIGETVTVTVTFASDTSGMGVEAFVTFEQDMFDYVKASGDNDTNNNTTGQVKITMDSAPTNSMTKQLQFKAKKAGSCKFTVERITWVATDDLRQITLSGNNTTVTVTNPSTSASSNANLTGLRVSTGTLTPAFSKDVTTYQVTIPYNVTELLVNCTTEDKKATAVVEGSKDMKVGYNQRVLVVTAENGTQKRYTINITRLDAQGEAPIAPPTEETPKKEVVADGQTMYIEENLPSERVPQGFKIDVYVHNGEEIPCVTDNNIVMLYLVLPETGEGNFYVVKKGSFEKMIMATVGGTNYVILPVDEKDIPVGYTQTVVTIGEQKLIAYKSKDASLVDFLLIYAKGPASYTGFYRFDTVEETMQRAEGFSLEFKDNEKDPSNTDDILANFTNNLSLNGQIVVITIIAIILLLIVAVIILIVKIATAGRNRKEEEEVDASGLMDFDFVTLDDVQEDDNEEDDEE